MRGNFSFERAVYRSIIYRRQKHFERKYGMESKTVYFDNPGSENTEAVLRIARQRAEELGIKTIVVASTRGDTAVRAMDAFKGLKVIIVSHATGFREPNIQEFTKENRKIVESKGGAILTTTHTFRGVSRALRNKFNTAAIGDIIANTLYIFGQGIKVACEISLMAADAGLVRTDEDVIAIAGTSRGADTAIVLTPVNSHDFFDLRVKEILCKPRF
jgi:hypothetical protein